MARPTKYNKDIHPESARMWAGLGMIDELIAHKLGITHVTFISWKKKYPEFLRALSEGKATVDDQVVSALLERAKGHDYNEVKTKITEDGATETTTTNKHIPGSVAAQKFWLTNRRPGEWKVLQNTEFSIDTDFQEVLKGIFSKKDKVFDDNKVEEENKEKEDERQK
jgi:hypothetical protein